MKYVATAATDWRHTVQFLSVYTHEVQVRIGCNPPKNHNSRFYFVLYDRTRGCTHKIPESKECDPRACAPRACDPRTCDSVRRDPSARNR